MTLLDQAVILLLFVGPVEDRVTVRMYLGETPDSLLARRALRDRVLALHGLFRRSAEPAAATLLLHAALAPPAGWLDLLLLAPNGALAAVVLAADGPIEVVNPAAWGGDLPGDSPLARVRRVRDAARARLERADLPGDPSFERLAGALVVSPALHPESRVLLDVDDHRDRIKVAGLDELPALAAMVRDGPRLEADTMHTIAAEVFGGRLWHDGDRFLFEVAASPFRLCVVREAGRGERRLALLGGENVIGRRRAPLHGEHRLVLAGDDLISNDHAVVTVADDGSLLLHDDSTNGTWVANPGAAEVHIHHAGCKLAPGAQLRMGNTRLRLERAESGQRGER